MIRDNYILRRFCRLSLKEQVGILWKSMDYMKEKGWWTKADCIAKAMGIPLFPKVISIDKIEGYRVSVTFDNGEKRVIDFQVFFKREKNTERLLLEDYERFAKVVVLEGALAWPQSGLAYDGSEPPGPFPGLDIDPAALYENSFRISSSRQ
jgi:hypothetical protein